MSLVARKIEAAGIPTVTLSVLEHATRALPAPRNVLVRFRLGQVFGEPGRSAQQLAIVRDALAALGSITRSGETVELPYRWKHGQYGGEPAR